MPANTDARDANSRADKIQRRSGRRLKCPACDADRACNAKRYSKHGPRKPKYKDKQVNHPSHGCQPGCAGCAHEG